MKLEEEMREEIKGIKIWQIILIAIAVAIVIGIIVRVAGYDTKPFVSLCMMTLVAWGLIMLIGDPGDNPAAGATTILIAIAIFISWAMMIVKALQEIGWGVILTIIIFGILGFIVFQRYKDP
ncbi:MAG: hypothetical protein U9Q72_01235 [Patescibacteria group bacterium]|nr:hypothetical protein [Patescibacteria group bacterium]